MDDSEHQGAAVGEEPVRAVFTRGRLLVFALALAVLAGVGVAYTLHAVEREDRERYGGDGTAPGAAPLTLPGPPRLLFRSTESGPGYGHLATVSAADPGGPRQVGDRTCDRVYAAAGTALCLTADRGVVTHNYAVVLDAGLREVRRVELSGTPNRARLSASGRMASWTVFVYGDSYAGTSFSTRTSILDTQTGALVASLEDFAVTRDGKDVRAVDRNFWGVTFTSDDNVFYATMSTFSPARTYLVRGDVRAREMTVLRENVECPSLSPDGTRLAFKKKVSDDARAPWRLYVLDLATGAETALAERHSVDDQAVWLDERTVAYSLPAGSGAVTDVWAVPSDGTGSPVRLIAGGSSPVPLG
ncbi:TolB family protein [Yinghuangia sp. ASG 101]|uniref:TolB family protein n=1 Tax=Yinghuangia sp. ASG 101 TaxID=2896848 RepID=UPI002F90B0CF